jgi:pimeloyl-ACP methyl ester carboxylesterase
METFSINGVKIAYERLGKGQPLLLIHGYPLDHSIWNETATLLQNDFDLILPDMRGFGQSGTVGEQYTVTDMADDLAGLLDHLKIEKAAVAGHSMGGYVALAFAKKYPVRVSGLGLVASQALPDNPERKEGRYKTAEDVGQKGVGLVADAMTEKLTGDVSLQKVVHSLIEQQKSAGIIGALKAMAEREDATPFLSSFKPPLALIHGDADALIPIERAREVKALVPSAHLAELPGAGHMLMMEEPKKTAEALKFLK